jgi:predicted phage terminase large subunit-like protein
MAKVSNNLLKRWQERTTWIQAATFCKQITEAEKAKKLSEVEVQYITWFEFFFPHYAKKKCAWYHKLMADTIIKNRKLHLLNEIFRSGGKSVHVDMGIPLFLYLVHKDLFFMLLIGETESKAKRLLSDIQAELEFNELIKTYYGERFQHGSWADGDFVTVDGVQFLSLGFGQNPRGARKGDKRPDYISVDDVDNKRHMNNDRMMREAVDYITEDIWGLFDATDTSTERFIFSNNNVHKNSITNRLKTYFNETIRKNKEQKIQSDTVIKVITVQAVKNLQTFEPSWPEKTSAKYWRNKFNNTPYRSFMREFMHVHVEDGAIFKYEDIIYCDALPLRHYDALCLYGDMSYKANADYKALILVGKTGKEFHIIFCYLRQKSRRDAARWLYDLYEKHDLRLFNIRYMIEGLFAQDDFVNDFDAEGEDRGYYIPMVADKRTKEGKYDRIESLAGFFERHNVHFNALQNNSDMQTLVDQFLAFEKGSQAHDDGPDACHGAFAYLNMRTHKRKTKYIAGKRQSQKF